MKNILLIGGEGYIGNVVSERLLSAGYTVTSFDILLYGNNLCILNHMHHPHYKFIFGDMLNNTDLVKSLVGIDVVVLLAGLVGDPITKKYPDESALINDKGVKNVIYLCAEKNIQKFIFVSTCSNYGLIENDEMANIC